MTKKRKSISYAKWGYFFIAPFFIVYIVFQLIPLLSTFYYSFFDFYRSGLKIIGPEFVGFKNYITLFTPDQNGQIDFLAYTGNTLIMWVIGAVPQLVFSLLLSVPSVAFAFLLLFLIRSNLLAILPSSLLLLSAVSDLPVFFAIASHGIRSICLPHHILPRMPCSRCLQASPACSVLSDPCCCPGPGCRLPRRRCPVSYCPRRPAYSFPHSRPAESVTPPVPV